MTDLDMWSAITGFGLPPLIAIAVRSTWKPWQRALAALIICLAAGGGTAWIAGDLAGVTPARAMLIVTFSALGAYRVFWHPSNIAPAIEKATNPADTPEGPGRHWHERHPPGV